MLFSESLFQTESKPNEAGSIGKGRRKERIRSFRRPAEAEWSEFLLTSS